MKLLSRFLLPNRKWKGDTKSKTDLAAQGKERDDQSIDDEIRNLPRYPPFATGMPSIGVDKILLTQKDLLLKIKQSLGLHPTLYEELVAPAVRNYAAYVHLLPASESHHHRGAGGLFRHGLEVAQFAAQTANGVIFATTGTPAERREIEPLWRIACCLAGLCHDVGKAMTDIRVRTEDGGLEWNPYTSSLSDWLSNNDIERYFLSWYHNRHKQHENFAALAVNQIVTPAILGKLSDRGPEILRELLVAINGTGVSNPVAKQVLSADQASVQRDLRLNRLDIDQYSYGVPIERYVIDALRRLVSSGQLQVNKIGGRVWHTKEGTFLVWPPTVRTVHDLLKEDNIPGVPKDPHTLADILIEKGIALAPNDDANLRYHKILPKPPEQTEICLSSPITVLKVVSEYVFSNELPPTVELKGFEEPKPALDQSTQTVEHHEYDYDPLTGEFPMDPEEIEFSPVADYFDAGPPQDKIEIAQEYSSTEHGIQKEGDDDATSSVVPMAPEKQISEPKTAVATPADTANRLTEHLQQNVSRRHKKEQKNKALSQPDRPNKIHNEETKGQAHIKWVDVSKEDKPSSEPISDMVEKPEAAGLSPQAALKQFLSKNDAVADLLIAIADKASSEQGKGVDRFLWHGKKLCLVWPSFSNNIGEPLKLLALLNAAGVVEPDRFSTGRATQKVGGTDCLVLTIQTSQFMSDLVPQPSVTGGEKTDSVDNSLAVDDETEASQQEPDHIPEKEKTQREAKARRSGTVRPRAIDSIRALKEMIIAREGRWLRSNVQVEGDDLVTSADALQEIIKESPSLKRFQLVQLLGEEGFDLISENNTLRLKGAAND